MKGKVRGLLLLSAVIFVASAARTQAQDFYWTSASARSAAMGGAYVESSSDVIDALATNPAGLSSIRGYNLNLAADAVFARGSFSNTVNTNSPLATAPGVVPYGAFGMPIGHSRFSFGVGLMPDMLSIAQWRYVDAPGVAGASYGLQEQKSAITALRSVAALGVSFGPKFSLGVSVGADYNTNTLIAPYIFQSQPQLAGIKTLLNLHTSGVGWNGSVGATYHPSRKLQVGVAWKSRTVIESTGNAYGDAYAQFAALNVNAPSTWAYSARVQNVLPQAISANVAWQANSHWLFAFQADWINWHEAFVTLPIFLSGGNNAVINSIVGGTSLQDGVPLHWKDQFGFHGGVERGLTENVSLRAGFAHENSPVPNSTLSPLTAAIMTNQISGGLEYRHGHSRYEVSYGFRPESTQHVGTSGLLNGEYNDSTVKVGTQSVIAGYSLRF